MAQKEIEVILARQWASYLAMPIFIVDPDGTMIYFNDRAEAVLGKRFEETGEMPIAEWSTAFSPTDDKGAPFDPDALPLAVALSQRKFDNARFWICGLDGIRRHIEVYAVPLLGQADRYLGAIAFFAELSE